MLSGSGASLPIQAVPTMRTTAALLLLVAFAGIAAAEPPALPRPPGLQPQIRFWTRIYSEVDTNGGLIHDARDLDVVYEVVRLPKGLAPRTREARVDAAKARYQAALRSLASGKRSDLSATERHVLALWGPGVSNATLRAAVDTVRFQLGQADKFRDGVIRSGLWEPHIREVFAERGLPPDVAALPHVESSFNPHAYSSAGAAGLWQFMRSTGRLYMRVDDVVDERFDPFKSTEAAARLLLENHAALGAWPLAITAYNHGRAGVRRAVQAVGTKDIAAIVQRYDGKSFGFASRNFYTELLAAIDVERDAERHFGPLTRLDPIEYDVVKLDGYYRVASLEKAFGLDAELLREHNLALRPVVWRGQRHAPKGFALRVPRHPSGVPAANALAAVPKEERHVEQARGTVHVVQRGEALSKIARRYGVSERELMALNGIQSRNRIRAGQTLRLPGGAETEVASAASAPGGTYRVKGGDTLASIARRHGVSQAQLASANGLRDRNRLSIGQRLRVPGGGGDVAVAAETRAAVERASAQAPPGIEWSPNPEVQPAPAAVIAAAAPVAATPVEASKPEAAEAKTPAPAPVAAAPAEAARAPAPVAAAPQSRPRPAAQDAYVVVEVGETLGHYASWLETSPAQIRRQNGLRRSAGLVIGQRVRLDFSTVSRDAFEARRREHHAAVRKEFFDTYRVAGTSVHVLRAGDTLWSLSRQNQAVPIWLLREYNPDVDLGDLRPGARIQIPRLEPNST
jgi:membrane-bound lytic murein transglycosylase D